MRKLVVFENVVRHKMGETVIDYKVRFDITGKIYNVETLFFDLPDHAQKLILGKNKAEQLEEIENFKKIIPILLPLIIVKRADYYANEFKNIYERITNEMQSLKISNAELSLYTKPPTLRYYIINTNFNPKLDEESQEMFDKVWDIILNLIIEPENRSYISKMNYIGYYFPLIAYKFFPLLIPRFKTSNAKAYAYECLKRHEREECRDYLLDQFDKYKDNIVLHGILSGLANQNFSEHLDFQKKLVDIYYADPALTTNFKVKIIETLKHFPNKATHQVGLDILKDNNQYSSISSVKTLIDAAYPVEHLAKLITPKLHVDDPKEVDKVFAILSSSKHFAKHLPSISILVKIYMDLLEHHKNEDIAFNLSSIIKHKYDFPKSIVPTSLIKIIVHQYDNSSSLIASYLSSNNQKVVKGSILLISKILYEKGINNRPFTTKEMKEKYFELLDHRDQIIWFEALKIIKKIGKQEKQQYFINLLLERIEYNKYNCDRNISTMRAINELLPVVKYEERITKVYLQAVKCKQHFGCREAALEGIRFSDDVKVKSSLAYLKDDPSVEVQGAAKKLNKKPKRAKGNSLLSTINQFFK